ncbi:MAG TPA: M20/M25/M40 family metallo-hydrolase, partial [Nitrososphaera sp.]|nr:M20/M25/M40 family metallo-hydrolase [Nitrososphaera sp.]
VSDGCGAIDNWSGIVTIAHLYRSLKDIPLKKTILFVAFGKEEKGLIGSRAMVDAIMKDQVAQYCEMINIDSFGLAAPQVADNMSSRKLSTFTADLANEMKIPFGHASIEGADADSSTFIAKKIPALTLHGLSNEWTSILHSRNDQSSKINPNSVYLGYRLILALVIRLDRSTCGEYR